MSCKNLSKIVLEIANRLDSDFTIFSSTKYPKDLGSWGLDENKLDELIRHLKKLKVELKVYDLNEEEFPKFKGKSLVEVELKSDQSSARKTEDVLKRLKAFPLEEHHVTNLKRRPKQEEEFLDKLSLDKEEREIIGAGKIKKEIKGWNVEVSSYISRGADPTQVTTVKMSKGNDYIELEEFQGIVEIDWKVGKPSKKVPKYLPISNFAGGNKTKELNALLESIKAPTWSEVISNYRQEEEFLESKEEK